MAYSNSTNYIINARQLIDQSFGLLCLKADEQPLQAAELQTGLNQLNLMLKAWQAQGYHLWSEEEAVLMLDVGQDSYLVGPQGDKCCSWDDFIGTTLTADASFGDTILTVDDTTGMLAGDYCGIQLSTTSRQWTTIVSVDSPTQITVTDTLTADSVSGNSVYTFTTLLDRPLRILSFRRMDFQQDNEIMVISWSRDQYFNQIQKKSQGTPVNAYYSPQLGNGRVYIWQTASNVNQLIRFTYEKPLDDIDVDTNDIEFPIEWYECIQYNLATRLCDSYNVPAQKVETVSSKAAMFLDNLLGFDQEITSILVQPYAKNNR